VGVRLAVGTGRVAEGIELTVGAKVGVSNAAVGLLGVFVVMAVGVARFVRLQEANAIAMTKRNGKMVSILLGTVTFFHSFDIPFDIKLYYQGKIGSFEDDYYYPLLIHL
jgi:uncharacterized membrane protein